MELTTRWGQSLSRDSIKPEYPRPGLRRDSYLNLNGTWEFCLNQSPDCRTYEGTIQVPFPPEAPLSGVGVVAQPEDYLHYRRTFTLPEGFDHGRILLHFGAVDQECRVCVNGQDVGGHQGGYLPFALDITGAVLPGENVIQVCARDRTEQAPYARGKQKLVRKGRMASIFYTPCSGIWKTVWLESVPERYITGLRWTPHYDEARVELLVETNAPGPAEVEISFAGERVWQGTAEANTARSISLPGFRAWLPEEPNLYDAVISFGEDRVSSYFGMRCIETGLDGNGVPRFYLNKRPVFCHGVLAQGYWPEGLLTAPGDEALRWDILTMKALGYNTLRVHVKVEEERFYYLCDKLGMLVWQDMPNGGGDYNMTFVTYLPNGLPPFGRIVRDRHYRWFARADQAGRARFCEELEGMVKLLYNNPCVVLWTPFNEGWGQFDARSATERIRRLDPSRLVNEACGWFDQGGGDLFSIHNYLRKLKVRPRPPRVVSLTECGGYAFPVPGHTSREKAFGYRDACASAEALTESYLRLLREEVIPNLGKGLSACIYTQLNDIEEEVNGMVTYDRAVVKLRAEAVQQAHEELYRAFEQAVLPGGDFKVSVL